MKKILCVTSLMAMIFWAGTSMAATINFYDVNNNGAVFDFDAGQVEQTWTFDLNQDVLFSSWNGPGYDPYGGPVDINPGDTISSAWVGINFNEDETDSSATLIVDGFTFENGIITTGFFQADIGISYVEDHLLNITIRSTSGNFEVYNLFVGGTFDNTPGPAPVPEPGTMLLFGSGLFGLAAVGRKKGNRRIGVK